MSYYLVSMSSALLASVINFIYCYLINLSLPIYIRLQPSSSGLYTEILVGLLSKASRFNDSGLCYVSLRQRRLLLLLLVLVATGLISFS